MSAEGDCSHHGFGSAVGLVFGRVDLLPGQFCGFCVKYARQFLLIRWEVARYGLHFLPEEELISGHGCLVVGYLKA